jgi:hypothetical protein
VCGVSMRPRTLCWSSMHARDGGKAGRAAATAWAALSTTAWHAAGWAAPTTWPARTAPASMSRLHRRRRARPQPGRREHAGWVWPCCLCPSRWFRHPGQGSCDRCGRHHETRLGDGPRSAQRSGELRFSGPVRDRKTMCKAGRYSVLQTTLPGLCGNFACGMQTLLALAFHLIYFRFDL